MAKKHLRSAEKFFEEFDGKLLSEKQLRAKGFSPAAIAELQKPDYGPLLSKRGAKFLVRPRIGEAVRLRYHPDNWPLAKEIILAAAKRGAHVSWTCDYSALSHDLMTAKSVEALEDWPEMAGASMKTVDVTIYLENEDDPHWKRGLPLSKLKAGQANGQKAHEILDSRKVRWLYLGWPFAMTAKGFGVPAKWFEKMVFASLAESFSPRTRKLVEYYYASLEGGDAVRITHADGSDLSFSVKGRPPLKDAGYMEPELGDFGLNLPSGESFISPLETTANGIIKFDRIHVDGHGFVDGLQLTFKGGRVVSFKARQNVKHFANYLKENTPSTRVLAELGIGANLSAKYSGYILTDEKIAGTIHLAIGNNTGSYHGKNKASGHLDMVKDMRKGVLWVDGKAVMKGGRPVW
jgi:leucyl aminopeptidase (aminopeptidase T)